MRPALRRVAGVLVAAGVLLAAAMPRAGSQPQPSPQPSPTIAGDSYPIHFSHPAHEARGAGRCITCHEGSAAAPAGGSPDDSANASPDDNIDDSIDSNTGGGDRRLPAPRKDHCRGCHDGTRAFALTTACTRCHGKPPSEPLRPRAGRRYRHHSHASLSLACSACHSLDPQGRPLPPGRDHQPCASAPCHQDQFAAREPTICGACHQSREPWRALHIDVPPAPQTEVGARFSHRAHLAERGIALACTDCHRRITGSRDMSLPGDHSACAGCHAATGGARPELGDCAGCHELGLLARRQAQQNAARWTTRARFRHQPHRSDPRADEANAPLACTACHQGVDTAAGLHDIPTPDKAACSPCHQGTIAFKLTGHGCSRCHGGAQPPAR